MDISQEQFDSVFEVMYGPNTTRNDSNVALTKIITIALAELSYSDLRRDDLVINTIAEFIFRFTHGKSTDAILFRLLTGRDPKQINNIENSIVCLTYEKNTNAVKFNVRQQPIKIQQNSTNDSNIVYDDSYAGQAEYLKNKILPILPPNVIQELQNEWKAALVGSQYYFKTIRYASPIGPTVNTPPLNPYGGVCDAFEYSGKSFNTIAKEFNISEDEVLKHLKNNRYRVPINHVPSVSYINNTYLKLFKDGNSLNNVLTTGWKKDPWDVLFDLVESCGVEVTDENTDGYLHAFNAPESDIEKLINCLRDNMNLYTIYKKFYPTDDENDHLTVHNHLMYIAGVIVTHYLVRYKDMDTYTQVDKSYLVKFMVLIKSPIKFMQALLELGTAETYMLIMSAFTTNRHTDYKAFCDYIENI